MSSCIEDVSTWSSNRFPDDVVQHFMHVIGGPPRILVTYFFTITKWYLPVINLYYVFFNHLLLGVNVPFHTVVIILLLQFLYDMTTTTTILNQNLCINTIYIFIHLSTNKNQSKCYPSYFYVICPNYAQ